jgi:hypothetical protein
MRAWTIAIVCLFVQQRWAFAEVASVAIASRTVIADGHEFGQTWLIS